MPTAAIFLIIKVLLSLISTGEDSEDGSLVHERVTSDDIARVVSLVTGIPVQVGISHLQLTQKIHAES
jgi:hypothetical protein